MNSIAERELDIATTAKKAEEAIELRQHLCKMQNVMDYALEMLTKIKDDESDDKLSPAAKIEMCGKVLKMGSGVVNSIKSLVEVRSLTQVDADEVRVRLQRTVLLGKRLIRMEKDYEDYVEGLDEIWSTL